MLLPPQIPFANVIHALSRAVIHTRAEGQVVDGTVVTVDLLQCSIAVCVPDGGCPIFASRDQQCPRRTQINSVDLIKEANGDNPIFM